MIQFNICRDLTSTLDRVDVKHIRYISGMNNSSPKGYSGSIVDKGPRSAWLICNPGGVRVYLNPQKFDVTQGQLRVSIGFNRLGPTAITPKDSSEFSYDHLV
jgi:hypothetical protein